MSEDKKTETDELAGVFVETALTNEQVAQAISEEERLGIRDGVCEFLTGSGVDGAGIVMGKIKTKGK